MNRAKTGSAPPRRWQHPALSSTKPALQAAADHATQVGEAHGWAPTMLLRVFDGLTTVLQDRPPGQPVPLTAVRAQTAQQGCSRRVAEVLAAANLLEDDTAPAIRSWIEQRTARLPGGFVVDVRAWLLVRAMIRTCGWSSARWRKGAHLLEDDLKSSSSDQDRR